MLRALSPDELTRRFDPARMTELEIYPTIWDREDDDTLGYLLEHFTILKTFVERVAREGRGLIVFIG